MNNCQKCNSLRLASVSAKCSDRGWVQVGNTEHQGYIPHDLGIDGGDYVAFTYCLECGQMQGNFPLPQADIEKDIADAEVEEFYNNYFKEGQLVAPVSSGTVHQIESHAKDLCSKFGSFMVAFFELNDDEDDRLKMPSVEKFVKMYRDNIALL